MSQIVSFSLFFTIVILFSPIWTFYEHHCIHEKIAIRDLQRINSSQSVYDESRRNIHLPRFTPSVFDRIRVLIDTETNLEHNIPNEPEKIEYLKNIIFPSAISWLGELLEVIPRKDGVSIPFDNTWCDQKWDNGKCRVVNTQKCGDFHVSIDHYDEIEVCLDDPNICELRGRGGGDVDFILYAASVPDKCEVGTVAYATACFIDTYDGNPLIGYINVCNNYIFPNDTLVERNQYVHIIVHEIFHALGFSESVFRNFLFHDGIPRTTVTKKFEERGETVTKFVTENSRNMAQIHFDCPTLAGLELEGGGGDGKRISHTEERVFKNDFMNTHVSKNPKFSVISLSVMHDSGWYRAKFENAEPLYFGNGAGCEFATGKCLQPNPEDPNLPRVNGPTNDRHFCNRDGQLGCTSSREGIATCHVREGRLSIPYTQQYYFGDSTKGGRYETMDYCPFFEMSTSCKLSSNMPSSVADQIYGEFYSPTSRCIKTTLVKVNEDGEEEVVVTEEDIPRCYNVSCDYTQRKYSIVIYDPDNIINEDYENITCSETEGDNEVEKTVDGWLGAVRCPVFDSICLQNEPYVNVDRKSLMWLGMLLVLGVIATLVMISLAMGTMFCFFTIFCTGALGDLIRRRCLRPIIGDYYYQELEKSLPQDYFGVGRDGQYVEELIRHTMFSQVDECSVSDPGHSSGGGGGSSASASSIPGEVNEEDLDELDRLDREMASSSSDD